MIRRRYEITVEGNDEDAVQDALAEAVRRIKAGNREGTDRNEECGFSFTSGVLQHTQD